MDLEQIVKETVAKIVAEKTLTAAEKKKKEELVMAMKKDFKGPEAALYAIATDKAKKLAEDGLNEDYEVAMAQDSLDSIIRAAMMLKAQMGDKEINLPAWIQDHITNSENYIYQAAKGYHESTAQTNDEAGSEEMNEEESERSQKATKALDASLLKFLKNVYKDTPSDKIPEKYRNIINQNGSQELNEEYNSEKSAVESASGDKISNIGYDDMDLPIFFSATDDTISYHLGYGGEFEGKIYKYDGKTGKSIEIGDLKHYGDGQNHSADDDMHESQQELDEWTISRWQHYAGIK